MTARVGTMSVDGTPISRTDLARIRAEEELHADQQRRAVRVVAAAALDADDCRTLLSILGLEPDPVTATRATPAAPPATPAAPPAAPPAKGARKRHAA